MELTIKQEEGLRIALARFKNREKYTVISGYAGTGKSTLIRFIIDALSTYGIDEEQDVCFACFTGKACQVLLNMGNKNVSTLHRLLYESIPKPTGGWIRKKKDKIDYKIIVVDEVSMAPKQLMDLLFRHNVHVICLGDPFQLPPVDKDSDNHLLDHPHIFLDEIMRQSAESEIIQLATKIRNFEPFGASMLAQKEVMILPQKELNTGILMWGDQVLVATNATRVNFNQSMRNQLGHQGMPEDGDKVICLRNYWDDFSEEGNPLVNGTIGYLRNAYESFLRLPYWAKPRDLSVVTAEFISDTGEDYGAHNMDKKLILEGEKTLDWKTAYRLNRDIKTAHLVPYEFTYGYAITCHKAQGSQWSKVVVYEETFPRAKEEHARWLYTAVTRASEKVVLLR